tara:strand:+ start:184 stop:456 length:273 start_codon:yes stop_codon:yes gene_type:complete
MDTIHEARLGARKVLDQRIHNRTVILMGADKFVDMSSTHTALHKKTDGEHSLLIQDQKQKQTIAKSGLLCVLLLFTMLAVIIAIVGISSA